MPASYLMKYVYCLDGYHHLLSGLLLHCSAASKDSEPATKDTDQLPRAPFCATLACQLSMSAQQGHVLQQGSALPPGRLRQIMEKGTPCCKARLLHYFAAPAIGCDTELRSPANWCGWHTDHGSLTGALLIPSQASRTEALGDESTMVDR